MRPARTVMDWASDLAATVAQLSRRSVNYAADEAPPPVVNGWHHDDKRVVLGYEEPGRIVEGGLAQAAAALVNSYEFADPAILRAVYRRYPDLLGRDVLLVGRCLPPLGSRCSDYASFRAACDGEGWGRRCG